MKRNYNTRQREAVLSYIASLGGKHATAAQISAHFAGGGEPIGRTTVYRLLEKLTESGHLRKYTLDGNTAACYQYAEHNGDCHTHLHLKCEGCGKLLHLRCDMLEQMKKHFHDEHAFLINAGKTVLYGVCGDCRRLPEPMRAPNPAQENNA